MFKVEFRCANCGSEWTEAFKRGDRLEDQYQGPWLKAADCSHDFSCKACRYIECPNCGLSVDVSIKSQQPVAS